MYLHEYDEYLPARRESLAQEIHLASGAGATPAGVWLELTEGAGGAALREAFEAILEVSGEVRHPNKADQLQAFLLPIRDNEPPAGWSAFERERQALMSELAGDELRVVAPGL